MATTFGPLPIPTTLDGLTRRVQDIQRVVESLSLGSETVVQVGGNLEDIRQEAANQMVIQIMELDNG